MEPIEDLLSRKPQDDVDALLSSIADSIEEIVNFGTHIFEWFEQAVANREDEVAPIAMSLKHFLEMLDAISVLIRRSIIEPSKIQLRSALEASMSIAWILQKDSERRAMAFMVWNVHEKLKWPDRFDKNVRQNLNTLLSRPKYRAAEEEYQRLRKKIKNPNWYNFFGGPQNIQQLAAKVEMNEWYELFYRECSGVVHASDIIFGKVVSSGGKTYIQRMRSPVGVERVYTNTVSMALTTYKSILEIFIPSKLETFTDWYVSEVRDFYIRLSSGNPVIVPKAF